MVTIRALFLAALSALALLFVWSSASAAGTFSLLPNGEGSNLQFTPSAGATHYTLVDETPCNGTTDYNRTTTVGHRDSYTVSLSSVPDGATVTDIAIKPCASRNSGGGGSSTMNVFYRFNGATSTDAGAYALSGTTPAELATTTFSSLSLDKVSTSTAEIGAVYSAGTRGVRLSRISAIITYNPLTAPTGLSGNSSTTSAILLSWSDNSLNEDGFEVERSPDGSSWALIATRSANATNYNDTGLSAATTYHYRVRTFNAGVYSAYSNTVVVSTKDVPPNAPSSLSANASTTALRISLAWTDNSSNESSFKIERQIGAGAFTLLTTVATNTVSYDDNAVSAGTTYGYRVSAFNTTGGTSTPSNSASSTAATAPAAPTGLSGTASSTIISLLWSDNATNELLFAIERRTVGGVFSSIATTSANTTSYDDFTPATTTTTYIHRVRAWNGVGYSAYSNQATTTTP